MSDPFAELFASSALDSPLAVTFFKGKTDTGRTEERLTLRALAERIHAPARAEKGALPLLSLTTFGDDRAGGKALRNAANAREVWGVEGDHDAGTVSLAEARDRLSAAGVAALLYSTPSSTPAAPRWRVLAPASGPVTPEAREALVSWLDAALGGCLARESWRLAQAYYFGRVRGATGAESALVDGLPIDRVAATAGGRMPESSRADDEALLQSIASGAEFHQPLASLIGRWLLRGDSVEECERKARAAMEAVPNDARDRRWRERFKDIPRVCRDIAKADERKRDRYADQFDDLPDEPEPENSPRADRLRLLTPAECADTPSRGYVVKGLLAPSDVACVFGPPGAGKSLLAPFIGYAIARGETAFGMRAKPGAVLYVAAEDPHGMRGRIAALKIRHGDAPDFRLVEGVSDLLESGSDDLAALRAHVRELRPAVIVIDTLAMAFPGLEENSADGMGRVVAVARKLAESGAAVVLIHHDTKAGGPTPRGHSLLNGALDVALQLAPRDESGIVRAKLTKNRNGSCDRDIAFTIAVEILGKDEDGDAVTVAVADPLPAGAGCQGPKLSPSERAALKILKLMADHTGAAAEADWRARCVDGREVSGADDPDSRRRAVKRAFEGLARKGYIRAGGGRALLSSRHSEETGIRDQFDDLPMSEQSLFD